ncbi:MULTISPECIES: phenylalanine 4-monooxygenase [unclassified Psychrobacter]|uniref:phenylalanine 4-monooxygenase n=1 Tax=unclassified Psychrobacter TaxID=196806 RepID=UPI0025B4BE0F|nr:MULTISPECIES: phenylalanine 4-monooxygenase [unclassified Psychrobacter]MDN3453294.1 phenylalanine 4-monooxygenase [Psychrobacter sp. APC 3350]MDN3503133.1 phenylalanine 4-monooxygenase [Psychrobacter sp. 5A.1]
MERLSHTDSFNTAIGANSSTIGKQSTDESASHNTPDKKQPYLSHQPDANGYIHYSDDENGMWQALLERQAEQIPNRACPAYLEGLKKLNLPPSRIPQLHDIDDVLQATTGWKTAAVPALISFGKFFKLLANKSFPVATFIRRFDDMDYIEEPDIFHEIVGHCPLLTHPAFATFNETYGKLGLNASKEERWFLARLYWFTIEFGLVGRHTENRRIYGGGILSSPSETVYALSDASQQHPEQQPQSLPEHRAFDLLDVLRTPYRIDHIQPIYYVIDDLNTLFDIVDSDIMGTVKQAMSLGLFEPTYPEKTR